MYITNCTDITYGINIHIDVYEGYLDAILLISEGLTSLAQSNYFFINNVSKLLLCWFCLGTDIYCIFLKFILG